MRARTNATANPIFILILFCAQIRRGGRWNADQMTGCYLTTLPSAFLRGIAILTLNGAQATSYPVRLNCPQ